MRKYAILREIIFKETNATMLNLSYLVSKIGQH